MIESTGDESFITATIQQTAINSHDDVLDPSMRVAHATEATDLADYLPA